MVDFKFNPGALEQIGRQAVGGFIRQLQPALDSLFDRYQGQPVDVVKPALSAEWRAKAGKPLSEPQLTQWATLISEGKRIVLQNGG